MTWPSDSDHVPGSPGSLVTVFPGPRALSPCKAVLVRSARTVGSGCKKTVCGFDLHLFVMCLCPRFKTAVWIFFGLSVFRIRFAPHRVHCTTRTCSASRMGRHGTNADPRQGYMGISRTKTKMGTEAMTHGRELGRT